MEDASKTVLRIGNWRVNPGTGEISQDGQSVRLESRAMLILLCLAERAGEIVSIDELLSQVWHGVNVSPDSVYQAVTSLRRQLGDDPKNPAYIVTVPRLGYRMVAKVTRLSEDGPVTSSIQRPRIMVGLALLLAIAGLFALAIAMGVFFLNRSSSKQPLPSAFAAQPQKSVAVLPFLDLTDGMKEEEFADGITEELINRLSKIPDFRVPAATSSFYFKGKQVPVADIARNLGVSYVLDGSVRKSAARFRIAARLVRAENGYVLWSESYDRPLVDKILVQEDIAGEVAKALQAEIAGERPVQ